MKKIMIFLLIAAAFLGACKTPKGGRKTPAKTNATKVERRKVPLLSLYMVDEGTPFDTTKNHPQIPPSLLKGLQVWTVNGMTFSHYSDSYSQNVTQGELNFDMTRRHLEKIVLDGDSGIIVEVIPPYLWVRWFRNGGPDRLLPYTFKSNKRFYFENDSSTISIDGMIFDSPLENKRSYLEFVLNGNFQAIESVEFAEGVPIQSAVPYRPSNTNPNNGRNTPSNNQNPNPNYNNQNPQPNNQYVPPSNNGKSNTQQNSSPNNGSIPGMRKPQ